MQLSLYILSIFCQVTNNFRNLSNWLWSQCC